MTHNRIKHSWPSATVKKDKSNIGIYTYLVQTPNCAHTHTSSAPVGSQTNKSVMKKLHRCQVPTQNWFAGEVNRGSNCPPGFDSHYGLSHPNDRCLKRDETKHKSQATLTVQIPIKYGFQTEESLFFFDTAPSDMFPEALPSSKRKKIKQRTASMILWQHIYKRHAKVGAVRTSKQQEIKPWKDEICTQQPSHCRTAFLPPSLALGWWSSSINCNKTKGIKHCT